MAQDSDSLEAVETLSEVTGDCTFVYLCVFALRVIVYLCVFALWVPHAVLLH